MKWQQGSWWIRNVLVAGVLIATGCVAIYLKWNGNHLSWLWPPPGVALASLLVLGLDALPGLFAGAAIGAAVSGVAFPLFLIVAACFCGSYYVALALLRQFRDFDRRLTRLRDVLLFLLIGCALAPLALAGFGTISALLSHRIQPDVLWPLFRNWWLGDGLGPWCLAAWRWPGAPATGFRGEAGSAWKCCCLRPASRCSARASSSPR